MKKNIFGNLNRTVNKLKFKGKKYSPEILVVAGVIGAITSAVMACKATTKLDEIVDDHKEKVDAIHKAIEDPESLPAEYDPEKDGKKDLVIVYTQTSLKVAKLYAPSVILGSLALGSLVGSNHILKRRNAALTAAYATVESAFKKYRANVVDKYGSEVDCQLRNSIKAVEVEDKKGKKKKEEISDLDEGSDFSRFFDQTSPYWEPDAVYNKWFLNGAQARLNDRLKRDGYLFLNTAYEELGMEPTKAGQVMGWVYDAENPNGDNYVDFGIYHVSKANQEFVNGDEPVALLNFNIDGNIYDLMS